MFLDALNSKNYEKFPDQNIDLPNSFFVGDELFLLPILPSENVDL